MVTEVSQTFPDSQARAATRRSKDGTRLWTGATAIISLLLLAPIFAVFVAASGEGQGNWGHLVDTVLPRYIANTLILMLGVGAVALIFGISGAWAVTRYDFPGRRLFEWALLLPAAIPAYLIAYTYTDFLEYAGPVQGLLRDIFGWHSARDYWFPEIRSMGGAMLVIGAVLYPYVYMMTRTAFLLTPGSLFEAGLLARRNLLFGIALPLARPAIIAGLALVMMETISDFGTVEYFAVRTLTLGIFNVWLGMNDLTAAAQIACFAFLFILALLAIELHARSRRRYADTSKKAVPLKRLPARGASLAGCLLACIAPIAVGFILPVGVLLSFILRGYSLDFTPQVIDAGVNSLIVSGGTALLVIAVAGFLVFVSTYRGGPMLKRLAALSAVGYAFPGTILAIGVVTAAGALDSGAVAVFRDWLGFDFRGWFSSGVGLVLFACLVRFQAVGYGAISAGIQRLPPNLINASRVLGHGFGASLRKVVLPLMRGSILAGGLLVFVDVMKELPMTLLLRPFNFETLATYVYQYAKDELLEQAAMPALMIVIAGIGPVMLMNAALRRLTRGT